MDFDWLRGFYAKSHSWTLHKKYQIKKYARIIHGRTVLFIQKIKRFIFTRQPWYFFPFLLIWAVVFRSRDKKKNPQHYLPHGVYVFTGLYGSGKSLSLVKYLLEMKQKYPTMKIYTNFKTPFSELLVSIKQIERETEPAIFCIDEAQLTFDAHDYADFPWLMVSALSQNRKEAKLFLFATQGFEHVVKRIRDLTQYIIECRSWGGMLFRNRWYTPIDFEKRFLTMEKRPFAMKTHWFFGYPELFDTFSSLEKLTKLKFD